MAYNQWGYDFYLIFIFLFCKNKRLKKPKINSHRYNDNLGWSDFVINYGGLPKMVKDIVEKLDEVDTANIKLVWSPPWTKDMMSEAAKLELNL